MTEAEIVARKRAALLKVMKAKEKKDSSHQAYVDAVVDAWNTHLVSFGELGDAAGVDRAVMHRLLKGRRERLTKPVGKKDYPQVKK